MPRLLAPLVPDALWSVPTEERVAYLTFDDGPTQDLTRPILHLLAEADVKATFFLIGRYAKTHPDLVRAIQASGHTIGNHSMTHPYPWAISHEAMLRDAETGSKILEDITGERIRYFRPPYGQLTGGLRRWCATYQQRCAMWDVAPADFLSWIGPIRVKEHICRFVRPGSIIVLHDNPVASTAVLPALPAVIQELKDEGWRFEAL